MRSFNIDREPIGSEEIATFKDFKSIMRKHAQTTEDLEKIKPNSSFKKLGFTAVGVVAIVAAALFVFGGGNDELHTSATNSVLPEEIVEPSQNDLAAIETQYDWDNLIRTTSEDIENRLGAKSISANRVKYAKMDSKNKINALVGSLGASEVDFINNAIAFKIDEKQDLSIKASKNLYVLGAKQQWNLVSAQPVEMPFIEKPRLLEPGVEAVQMNFKNYDGPASEYQNVFWSPVDGADLADEFYTTLWEDAAVEKTSIDGVYKLKFKAGERSMSFNGYPVLQKSDYDKAMKNYNSKLVKAQSKLKKAPKNYNLQKGIYTIK